MVLHFDSNTFIVTRSFLISATVMMQHIELVATGDRPARNLHPQLTVICQKTAQEKVIHWWAGKFKSFMSCGKMSVEEMIM